jgi:glycosyltransferase involved in cell wall biosynthesis
LLIAERLRRAIERFAPTDLIIQYTPQMFDAWRWGSAATLWLAMEARRKGVNVVVLAHELFLSWSPRPDLALGAALLRAQFATLAALANRVFVTVDARARRVAGWLRVARIKSNVGVIRVGAGALPVERKAAAGTMRIGTFSTLGSGKRFDVTLDCFTLVGRQRPDAELTLLGDLGDSGQSKRRELDRTIAAHPARNRIRIAGKQTLSAIADEVAALDIFLFPMDTGANTRSSTLPLALGSGLPVVAIRGVETDNLFVDRENIMFAASMAGDSFAAATMQIATDLALAKRVSQGAAALYRDHLSWQRIGDDLLAQI